MRRIGLMLVVACLTAGACGISSDDQPRAIPDPVLPEQVVEPREAESPPTSPVPGSARQRIFFVTGPGAQERLFPTEVSIEGPVDPAQLPRRVIEQLIRTRPEDVGIPGATNQLPSDVQVLDATRQDGGILDLNLTPLGIEGAPLRLAMAQLVFTATDLPNINQVRLFIDGNPTSVSTPQGDVDGPVGPENYGDLNPFVSEEGVG